VKLLRRASQPGQGDQEATLHALLPKLRAWLLRYLGPSALLDDVVQDALIEIAKALPKFRGDSTIDTFAYRIAIRVASRALKKQSRHAAVLKLVPPPIDQIDPRSQLADRHLLQKLYEALDSLSHKQRSVFVLCELEQYSPTEASKILKLKPTTVRSQLRRAREALSLLMDDDARETQP